MDVVDEQQHAREPMFDLRGERSTVGELVHELTRAQQLVRVLARKDFFVRYRRATFGIVWALALPLVQAAVLALVLPRFVRFEVDTSYVVFAFAGTVLWSFFAGSIVAGAGAIVDGQDLSTRVYFPRMVLPLVAVLANAYGFLAGLLVLAIVAGIDGALGADIVLLVPAAALAVAFTAALASILAALQVYFRDVRYIAQAALLAWFYVTPVIYPLSAVPTLRGWLLANPLTGIAELLHSATGTPTDAWGAVAASVVWTLVLGAAALVLHARHDRVLVDLL